MIKRILSLSILLVALVNAQAQKYWTLDECVNTALKNNISLKQRDLTTRSSKADLTQSKLNLMPNLNGQVTNNWNIGFAINPVTNATERDATFRNNNFSLSSSLTLFNGFQNTNNVRLQESNVRASEHDLQSTKNNIALTVCNAYLQTLFNLEIVESRRLQVQTTQSQVEKQQRLFELGGANKAKFLQLKAQFSNEELQLVTAENQLSQSYLTLWQAMNILPDTVNKVAKPELDATKVEAEARTSEQVYETYLQTSPEIKASQQRTRSAALSTYIASGGRSPRLTLSAGLNSFYSTQNQQPTGITYAPTQVTFVDAQGQPVFTPYYTLTPSLNGVATVPFGEQFDKNLGKSIGLTLSLPIFNGGQVNNNVQKQRINQISAELNEQQTRNDMYKNVSQSYLDFKSAQKKYESNVNNLDANKEAFSVSEGQYNLGALSTNDYLQTRNAYLQAETNYLQAKYELIFRRKVLDFYLGKPLY